MAVSLAGISVLKSEEPEEIILSVKKLELPFVVSVAVTFPLESLVEPLVAFIYTV